MIRLTESDLADLARYPASLQQAALALWGDGLSRRVASVAPPPLTAADTKTNIQTSGTLSNVAQFSRFAAASQPAFNAFDTLFPCNEAA
jgi:hypothetical protein